MPACWPASSSGSRSSSSSHCAFPDALPAAAIVTALVLFATAVRARFGSRLWRGLPPGSLSLARSVQAVADRHGTRTAQLALAARDARQAPGVGERMRQDPGLVDKFIMETLRLAQSEYTGRRA